MARRRSISGADLRAQSELLAKAVLRDGLASPEALTAHQPGGPENPETDARGALRYLCWLHRQHARREQAGPAGPRDPLHALHDAQALDALRAQPELVELTAQEPDGRPRRLAVHPKSLDALLACQDRQRVLDWLCERIALLELRTGPESLELLARATAELAYQYGCLAWIVTHPGPRRPPALEDDAADPAPPLPDGLRDLEPFDLQRLGVAHAHVNGRRLEALRGLLDPTPAEQPGSLRASWSIFAGAFGDRVGLPGRTVMRDWSLGEILAQMESAAAVTREAQARGKESTGRDAAEVRTRGDVAVGPVG